MLSNQMGLSTKQIQAIKNSNARINVWEGSVRSGKSFSALLAFLDHILHGPDGDMFIIGKSQDAIKRNVLSELTRMLDTDLKVYAGKREIKIYGRTIHLIGASDDRAEGKIRGASISGALVDEITIIPESFFMMLLSRLSIEGAKLYGTTNPDSPYHWFKVKFIDRKDELNMNVFSFHLDDNPSLTEEYKDDLKSEYSGLWYDRYIEGKWCLAEGIIYDFFDLRINCLDFVPSFNPTFYLAGIDYGTTNPTSFLLVGVNYNHSPNIWVEKEYYYDPSTHLRQKTDAEFSTDFISFIDGVRAPVKSIYIDPAAASFKVELIRSGIRNIKDADNDVLDGIRLVSTMMSTGQLKIVRQCKNLIKEFGSYVWDPKARESGLDKPVKKNDHAIDALRYIIYSYYKNNLGSENRLTPEDLKNMRRKWGIN